MVDDSQKPPSVASDLVPGVVATAALGATVFALHLPILVAIGTAAAVYGGTRLLMSGIGGSASPSTMDEETRVAIVRGRAQVTQLRGYSSVFNADSVRNSVAGICHSAELIFSLFESDPRKAAMARGFVDYTLTRTLGIVARYRDLSSHRTAAAQTTLSNVETLLETIDRSFRDQIDRLVAEDAADLDSEVEVLKTRLEIEGETS